MQVAVVLIGLNMILFTAFRILFWGVFRSSAAEAPAADLWWALYLGFKFDLRLSLLICLPVMALSWVPGLNFVRSLIARKIWVVYLIAMTLFLVLTYFVDLAHYEYLHDRLNASAIDHVLSFPIALRFVWETYAVIPGVLLIVAATVGYGWVVNRFAFRRLGREGRPLTGWQRVAVICVALALSAFGIYGKWSRYPLRWSEAYSSTNPFVSALALNPVLFFFDTREYKTAPFNEEVVRKHYDLMADFLDVDDPDPETLNFSRSVIPEKSLPEHPNIVFVLLESFAGFKIGAFGNKLAPTPSFDAIAQKSLLFTNFFVTRPPTARAVFTSMFGIPDIHSPHSASRNPLIIRQYTMLNALERYNKMYILGGSANWGNIRGILGHNIPGLQIYEEGDFAYPPDDVWGISDYHLFEEANGIFRAQNRPFFALLHTAGNHKPFTIPEDKGDFKEAEVDERALKENGFESLKSYNGIRFLDYCLGHFFRLASQEDYFRNTIFCVFADHGTIATRQIPWDKLTLTAYHIPFAIYAPGYFSEGRKIDATGSLVDVLPTVFGLMGVPHVNKTLGRDLLSPRPREEHIAFIDAIHTGLVNDDFLLLIDPQGVERLYPYRSDSPLEDVSGQYPIKVAEMVRLCYAIRETSKYLLYHNAPLNDGDAGE